MWIGRPDGYLLSTSGHIIEAQKAWAAEQIERQLPVTLAAWEAWLTGPTKVPTAQPMGSAGIRQLRHKHLEHQRAKQAAWVIAQTQQTGKLLFGDLMGNLRKITIF